MVPLTAKQLIRFWARIEKHDANVCWLWTGCVVKGYGQVVISGHKHKTHRLAYALEHGIMPDSSVFVCHTCDTPLCCNPRHLFLGDSKTNNADRAIKGRSANTKLTPTIVQQVRNDCMPGDLEWGYSALAKKYGVNPGAIWQAVNGTRWAHVK